jgi:hypothetical protein
MSLSIHENLFATADQDIINEQIDELSRKNILCKNEKIHLKQTNANILLLISIFLGMPRKNTAIHSE